MLSPYHAMACNPAMMVDPLGLASGIPDFGITHPLPAPIVVPVIPVNTNARFAYLDRIMYADQAAFHERLKQQRIVEDVLNALDYGLSLLGFESRSVSAALGRSTSAAGEIVQGEIIDHSTLGTDKQSYQFGDLKISFSKRGGGDGIYYDRNEHLRRGIWVFAVYEGDLSAYDKTDWVQSVYSTAGINGNPSNEWFNDYNKDTENGGKNINRPFYYDKSRSTKAWRRDMDAKFGGRVFHDGPNRMSYSSINFSWSAQLSLVGLRNGTWETIQTVRYGFSVSGSTVTYSPMLLNHISNATPNYFHQSLINLLNSYREK